MSSLQFSPANLLGLLIRFSWLLILVAWLAWRIILPDSNTIFSGSRPSNLGVVNKQFALCPVTPNCISSQSQDSQHKIEPLIYQTTEEEAVAQLKKIIENQKTAKLIATTDNYLYAEFTSRWLGFVDDVEFYFPQEKKIIEVRSASRLGESDLGVNRQRIETIRSQFQ